MKKIKYIVIILIFFSFISCSHKNNKTISEEETFKSDIEGTWSRDFETLPGKNHTASYTFKENIITYDLRGATNAHYDILIDTVLLENNFIIGHIKDGIHFLIAIKDENSKSIALHKEEVNSLEDGLKMKEVTINDKHNLNWYTYSK